jgi:hypothetical protein
MWRFLMDQRAFCYEAFVGQSCASTNAIITEDNTGAIFSAGTNKLIHEQSTLMCATILLERK